MLEVYRTEEGLKEGHAVAELLAPHGIQSRIRSADDVRDLLHGMKVEAVGGVHYLQDAHLNPQQFVTALARYVERQGVTIQRATEILGFDTNGREVTTVKTTRGDFQAGEIVIAAGSWARDIGRMLDLRLWI